MARRLRRSLRRARLRTWRAVRTYPMLLVTFAVLGLALAGGAGVFQSPQPRPGSSSGQDRAVPQPADPVVAVTPAGLTPQPVQPVLVMTYYLVSTPEMEQIFNTVKDELRFREWLEKSAFEVLLIRTPEDEQRARDLIATAQSQPLGRFVVEDLRTP